MRSTIFRLSLLLLLIGVIVSIGNAQEALRIEPPFWWSGMQNQQLQLLVHSPNIGSAEAVIADNRVKLIKTHPATSPNYLFLDLEISNSTEAFAFPIQFKNGKKLLGTYNYKMKKRNAGSAERKGFGNEDVLYLITPDRFANGNTKNDEIAGLKEGVNRSEDFGRHGGDIEGIRKNLDYINELGFTAIWLNPVLINDQPKWSYHGYATTDYYKVDPRFGSNEEYINLSKEAKAKGIGMIMDIIVNHCGSEHWWMADPPFDDWINYQNEAEYIGTNHRKATLLDPYGSKIDRERMTKGWFVPAMPDLNQRNTFMSTYLIQNSIWWIEYADLSGIRQDTYSYPFREFMTDWTCAIQHEYPNFNIVGEEWVNDPSMVSYWQEGKKNQDDYASCLPSLMDFPLNEALRHALVDSAGWNTGMIKLYETLALDYHYAAPNDLVIFPDNHDMSRIYTVLNEDYDLLKIAVAHTLTMRGVPQFYYGTEILMSHPDDDSHGAIREDYPGGWPGDAINAFTNQGLSAKEIEARKYFKKLLHWRKNQAVIHTGDLKHYIPYDEVYVYFRSNDENSIMVVLNKNDEAQTIPLKRFSESLMGYGSGTDVATGREFALSDSLAVPPKAALVLELKE